MELRAFLYPLRKWWWLILVATILAAASSYFVSRDLASVYIARSTLLVGRATIDPNPTGNAFALGRQLADVYADMAKRAPIRDATKEALGLAGLPDYEVISIRDSQVIEIVVTDIIPERAQAVAAELADQLIQRSPTSSQADVEARQSFITQQLDYLEPKIIETQDEVNAAVTRLAELSIAVEIAETVDQIGALEIKLSDLQNNYASLLTSSTQGAVNTITLIEPATLPERPVGPSQTLIIAIATVIGFVLSSGAAYLLEYLDDTIKDPVEIDNVVNLPTLARILRIKGRQNARKPVTLTDPLSPASETFRLLRASVQSFSSDLSRKSLLVTSPNPAEGKSLAVANLAIVLAQAGHEVLLLDADLHRPVQHYLFELTNEHGLSTILEEVKLPSNAKDRKAFVKSSTHGTEINGLRVLTSGPLQQSSSDLLVSAKYGELLEVFEASFDYLIIDSPAGLAIADSVVLSREVGGVLIVVDAGHTGKSQLRQLVDRLLGVHANLLGVILNNDKAGGNPYGYYHREAQTLTTDVIGSKVSQEPEFAAADLTSSSP